MVQERKNQWNTGKWELEMETSPVLLGLVEDCLHI